MSSGPCLDLDGALPRGRVVIDASAGTGKTYSLSALVVRHVIEHGVPMSGLLVVTYTRAAAAELRDRIRQSFISARAVLARGHLHVDDPDPDPSWMGALLADPQRRAEWQTRAELAVTTFDDATIGTIHGFCQQALRQLGIRGGVVSDLELGADDGGLVAEVCRDLVVARLATDPAALGVSDASASTHVSRLVRAVDAAVSNPHARREPSGTYGAPAKSVEALRRWVELVDAAVAEVHRRRSGRRHLGFDDLVSRLHDVVCGDDADRRTAAVAMLRGRYSLVLVDEFQDTDPMQWAIFAAAFGDSDLVTVGDPKQAIFRFRGADVHAYLAATDGVEAHRLAVNFRSDGDLVAATNALMVGVPLGDPRIVAEEVAARPTAVARKLPGAPLQIRRLASHTELANASRDGLSAPLARQVVARDLAAQIVELLGTPRDDGALIGPGDIAVLVRSHSQADEVVAALTSVAVPAVRSRTGSVFATPAVAEWLLLLAAIEQPSRPSVVRAAALGDVLHRDAAMLDPQADGAQARVADLQRWCARQADLLRSKPFLAWFRSVREETSVTTFLLAQPDGERRLTDLEHIAEEIAAEVGGAPVGVTAVRRCLERLATSAPDTDDEGVDSAMRRIDSDADAVQVTTLHSSKGLQYPVVMLPFTWSTGHADRSVFDVDGRRVVDVAPHISWKGTDDVATTDRRRFHARDTSQGDDLRLFYVGVTRGMHRTVLWWAPATDADRTAFAIAAFDRDDGGRPRGSRPWVEIGSGGRETFHHLVAKPSDDVDTETRLQRLAALAPGCIEVSECPLAAALHSWHPPTHEGDAHPLTTADPGERRVKDATWRRWSYSSIVARASSAHRSGADGAEPTAPAAEPRVTGGADEPAADDPSVDDGITEPAAPSSTVARAPAQGGDPVPVMPFLRTVAGNHLGTVVHEVFEAVDFTAADVGTSLHAAAERGLRRQRVAATAAEIAAGVAVALHSPLGDIAGGVRLCDIPWSDRLNELDIDLPIVGAHRRDIPAPPVSTRAIGGVLLETLSGDDPLRGYAADLAHGTIDLDLRGYVRGQIDAVLRVPGRQGPRYVVVDYKTNRLHGRDDPAEVAIEAYHPDLLPTAMAAHHYPLQAVIYLVALHRFLRWRLAGYDPELHLGGAGYLFVRGMIGAATPTDALGRPYGVCAWRPSTVTVERLDRLFASGAGTSFDGGAG